MRFLKLLVGTIMLIMTACAPVEVETPTFDLLNALRAVAGRIEVAGEVPPSPRPLLSVPGRRYRIDGGELQVYEYPDEAAAQADARRISLDGSMVGTTMVDWVDTPHFFQRDRYLVLYLGNNPAILSLLESVLGSQIAGGPAASPVEPATPASDENNLANTQWRLVSFGAPGAETPLVEGSLITLQFEADGQVGGSGGCNSYGGGYQVQDNALSLNQLNSTLMACADERVTQQEQQYLQALQTAGRFELRGDSLVIWYDGGQGVLNFVRSTTF